MARPQKLVFITSNEKKVAEVKAILGDSVIIHTQSLDLVEIQGTVEEVTKDKCRRAADLVRRSPNVPRPQYS